MAKKRALVLSGGTAKGAFQAGMLKGLAKQDTNLCFDIIRGVSVGALNAAFLAQHDTGPKNFQKGVAALHEIWKKKIENDSVYVRRRGIFGKNSEYSTKPLETRLTADLLCLKKTKRLGH